MVQLKQDVNINILDTFRTTEEYIHFISCHLNDHNTLDTVMYHLYEKSADENITYIEALHRAISHKEMIQTDIDQYYKNIDLLSKLCSQPDYVVELFETASSGYIARDPDTKGIKELLDLGLLSVADTPYQSTKKLYISPNILGYKEPVEPPKPRVEVHRIIRNNEC